MCPFAADLNRAARLLRRPHVTMGLVSSPARRVGDGPAGADLLVRMRAGDRSAVDELYDRYSRPAFALARRILDALTRPFAISHTQVTVGGVRDLIADLVARGPGRGRGAGRVPQRLA